MNIELLSFEDWDFGTISCFYDAEHKVLFADNLFIKDVEPKEVKNGIPLYFWDAWNCFKDHYDLYGLMILTNYKGEIYEQIAKVYAEDEL